jgi:CubicO group peptidase (beta-lactamase class C family)
MNCTPSKISQIEKIFRENFERRGELGASLSIWHEGRELVSLAGGFVDRHAARPWTARTPVLVWSCTKGLAAACVIHALQTEGVSLGTPVSVLWPEFAQGGKEQVTVAQLLSHQAGLAALDHSVPVQEYGAVVSALAAQVPNWPLESGHGYHPRTYGWLLDEILRRVDGTPGMTLGRYWRTYFGVPMGLDFWIGDLPREVAETVSPVYLPKTGMPPRSPLFYKALHKRDSLTARAFHSPHGLTAITSMNTPEARNLSFPAFGGIGTAHALAKFYAMLAEGGALNGMRLFDSIAPMTTPLVNGPDHILLRPTAFSAGFMHDPVDESGKKLRRLFGPSVQAFGQPGSGGSLAFADPENRISFAYVMNQMAPGVMPNERALDLVEAIYA